MGKTRQRIERLFSLVGMVTVAALVLGCLVITCTCISEPQVPDNTVLELRLDRGLAVDGAADPLQAMLGASGTTLQQTLAAIERARTDERVTGLVAHLDGSSHGFARTEELRAAVLAFRESGKPAIAFAETMGELSSGSEAYYLATAFDEIYVMPSGSVNLTGLRSERMFLGGALELLEVKAEGGRRSAYKSAYEHYTATKMSAASREQTEQMLGDMQAQLVAAVASRFDDDRARALEVIEGGPYLAPAAVEAGLIDGMAYRDEILAKLDEKLGESSRLYPSPYLERAGSPWPDGEVIAVIHAVGLISRGPSTFDPIEGRAVMGSDTVVAAFGAAIEDEDVQAIVFRVDSPGGSAVASDAIWRATQTARDAGKPVIVSMGNYAASGGYYVSAGATQIVAQPSTLTGSIGVLAGKPVTRGLWNQVGISWDAAQTSPNAAIWSTIEPYDAHGRRALDAMLDGTYHDFKSRVAQGRDMTMEQVEELAQGRVWTGQRAKELGLVDELGGLTTAIALAKEQAGIDAEAEIELRTFPEDQGWLASVLGSGSDNSDQVRARASIEASLQRWRALAAQMRAVEMAAGEAGPLVVAPVEVR